MTLTRLPTVAALHVPAAITPGPAFVVALRVAVSKGFRPALGVAVGFGLGAAISAAAPLAGHAALFAVAPVALTVLKWAGAAFLLWLAVQMWRHARSPLPAVDMDRLFCAPRVRAVRARARAGIDRIFGGLFATPGAQIAIG